MSGRRAAGRNHGVLGGKGNGDYACHRDARLVKTYKGVQALKSLDLQVQPNSICGFLGPNGAGKTTTIKLLLGLARPTGGSGRFSAWIS